MRIALVIAGIAGIQASFWTVGTARGESRRFAVMLAHSPKTFLDGAGNPGLPPGGLFSVARINEDYFDRNDDNIDSFAEYWSEISYGDVEVSGDVFGWVTLPWAFEPNAPNGGNRPSPANFINLHIGTATVCAPADPVPAPFAYGAGEEFCDCLGVGGPDTAITRNKCGALIIIDLTGNNDDFPPPERGRGMDDFPPNAQGVRAGPPVWTPGERFLDVDGDNRWDGFDERNDKMCHGPNGCAGDPVGTGPRGCEPRGCGDLAVPCVDFNQDRECSNCSDTCVTFTYKVCASGGECPSRECVDLDLDGTKECTPDTCVPPNPDCSITLPECCDQTDPDEQETCEDAGGVPANEVRRGLNCGTPIFCCEFVDANDDDQMSVVEPFEDFMIRYNPAGSDPSTVWVKVDNDYVRNNYPGNVNKLIARTGNGYYDPPDLFFNAGSTKMMQDAGNNQFAWRTPKPGARGAYSLSPISEQPWFDQAWRDRYGSTPPPWPGGTSGNPPRNSPVMRPFDPQQPVPPVARGTSGRRWFQSNAGGWNGKGRGTLEDANLPVDLGTDDPDDPILPDEVTGGIGLFGYYDGWVEHDDLSSSIYHHAGDKRLGEITSPTTDRVAVPGTGEIYTAVFGADIGPHNPNSANRNPDEYCVAAGPGAFNIHGEKGFDAGDVCLMEWLTWRTDGTSPTIATRWEFENLADNGGYHPYAGPRSRLPGGPIGFRDYNLDGMIDQGEVRPERSENYSVDSNPGTANDGTHSLYPFDRRRMIEDVVEALDSSVNWNNYLYQGQVSGIMLAPPNAWSNINRFPNAPGFYPINTRDRLGLPFHDLPICQNCRDFPSAIAYAAHEYLHTWEGLPDLYDYERLDPSNADDENCPVGRWDIMADGGLVHPTAILKDSAGWIDPVDLESILTPGLETVLTLPPAEFVRDEGYYTLENSELPGERYWLWSAGAGFDDRLPAKGMLVMHTDARADPSALPLQQATPPFSYLIVQADGRSDLEACSSSGNNGDTGDVWPGITNARQFNFDTDPSASWTTPTRWTGLDITDVQPDGFGSVRLTLSLTPTNIPSLRFITPPGGESIGATYQVRFEATDVFGGSRIELYHTLDPASLVTDAAHFVGALQKSTPGTIRMSLPWNLSNIADGRYFLFGKLIPGAGVGGTERKFTTPRAGRNNVGNGALNVTNVDVSASPTSKARSETWTVVCTQADGTKWRVNSTLTQPPPATGPDDAANRVATTGQPYTSIGGEVTFTITAGSVPFKLGDMFTFTTTGITAVSRAVFVSEHRITSAPLAVINATPLSGTPPLTVTFSARDSSDPNGEPLQFRWDFRDGSPFATGSEVQHTYSTSGTFTVALRATNPANGRFDEAFVDIQVINNPPTAVIKATPTSGGDPCGASPDDRCLTVRFSATESSDTETAAEQLIYQWNFGNGLTANDAKVAGILLEPPLHTYSRVNSNVDTINCTATCPCTPTGRTCTASCPCTFTAVLTVTDGPLDRGGKSDTDSVVIQVGNSVPVVNIINTTELQGLSPLTVTFNAKGSTDPENDNLEVEWMWGDGSPNEKLPAKTGKPPATDGSVPHTFTLPADTTSKTYQVKATVRDLNANGSPKGGVATWSGAEVTVFSVKPPPIGPNRPPVASFKLDPLEAFVGEAVNFDAGGSFDPDGDELRYRWVFGDGNQTQFTTNPRTTHTYASAGSYVVRLTVRDEANASTDATQTVLVLLEGANRSPVAMIATGPRTGPAPLTLTFDGSISFDPDEDDAITFAWEFRQNGALVDPLTGSVVTRFCVQTQTDCVTAVFETAGEYTVELVVKDGDGAEGRTEPQSILVTERSQPPPPEPPPPRPGPVEPPDSAAQRPLSGTCGMGMLMSVFGSLLGLTLTVVTRRRLKA